MDVLLHSFISTPANGSHHRVNVHQSLRSSSNVLLSVPAYIVDIVATSNSLHGLDDDLDPILVS